MAYSLYKQVLFSTGLANVGYALYNPNGTLNTARAVVSERDTTGYYGALISFPTLPLEIRWDNGSGTYYSEAVNESPDLTTDLVWDEPLTGSSHNVGNSSGKRLRQLSAQFVWAGTAQSGGQNWIQLDTGASSVDGIYDPSLIFIDSGTGEGQSREIFQYDGSTRKAWVNRNWRVNPNATSTFQIYSFSGDGHTNEGVCGGGTTNTIILNRDASTVSDYYIGEVVVLVSGTGDDQAKRVIAYDGSTKTATVESDWIVVPQANDTVYSIYPTSEMSKSYIASATWDELNASHLGVGSTGAKLNSAGSSADPLANPVPGSYTVGTAGYAIGNLNSSAVTVVSVVSGGTINVYRGVSWSIPLTVGNITGNSKVYFTLKENTSDPDSAAIVQIEKTAGLLVLNGSSSVTSSDGSIVVSDASTGALTITLKPSATSQIAPGTGLSYDLKVVIGGSTFMMADGRGKMNIISDVTRKTS